MSWTTEDDVQYLRELIEYAEGRAAYARNPEHAAYYRREATAARLELRRIRSPNGSD